MPLEEKIPKLSERLLRSGTGDLAELRRMEIGGPGPAAYWRLAAECGFLESDADAWMRIVRIMALLTPKEQQVIHLVIDGKSSKEIAERLALSMRTVENHRTRIMGKLHVNSSVQLVSLFI